MQAKHERVLRLVIFIVVAAIALYFGYRILGKWHQSGIDSAVKSERQQWDRRAEKLIREMDQLQRQLEAQQETVVPAEKVTSVFGEKSAGTSPVEKQHDCERLKWQLTAFSEYLDGQDYVIAYRFEEKTLALFQDMLKTASQNLPVNIGETRDILTLLHNMAHFYRIFGQKKIRLIKDILDREDDFMEPVLATWFAYFFRNRECKDPAGGNISPEVFYHYAGFFLNTIGGRSYLFRRNSRFRILLNYYCVIILDQANTDKLNLYGIDIRPHIDRSLFAIRNHKGLQNQSQYLASLDRIRENYQMPKLPSP